MNEGQYLVSIIIPILNEEGNVRLLYKQLVDVLNRYNQYEIIFINDGSTDNTLSVIRALSIENPKVKFLSFSRNFGHQNALRAGLEHAKGDCIISMDGDMQHPPDLIPELISKWEEGYDIVYTLRKDDPNLGVFKRMSARLFYRLMNSLSDITIEKGSADFRLVSKAVNEVISTLPENPVFFRGLIKWLGFRQYGIEYMPAERFWGKSKYTFNKMLKFAVIGVTGFSIKPLHFSTILGAVFSIFAFAYGVYALINYFISNTAVSGWTSILAMVSFIGGVQLLMIGILGEYVGKMFIAIKKRPSYIIAEKKL